MRYAKSFLAAFSVAFTFAIAADSLNSAPATSPNDSSIVYDDGTVVVVERPGYPDVI